MLRLAGYIRVSRVGGREGDGYISPSVQRDAIEAYAEEIGGTIAEWHVDENFSGGTVDRPAFQTALEQIQTGAIDGIVVMRIDRFARSVADGARIVQEIVDAGQVFASCHERIDPSTPEGRFMLTSFLNNGQLERDQKAASWQTAKERAVQRGVHIGPTPVGYTREKSQPLTPDPTLGPLVSRLFERAATGRYGDSELARWFSEQADGGRPFQTSEVRRWLRNRVYLGEVRYGDLVNTEAHRPLTDPETWQRCQRAPGERRRAHSDFLLSGLVRCAHCRYAMGGQSRGGSDGRTRVYRCAGRSGCSERSVIVADRLEAFVVAEVRKAAGSRIVHGVPSDSDLAGLGRDLAEAEAEVQAFASDLDARRMLGDAGWREALAVRVAERDRLRGRVERARAERATVELVERVGDLEGHDLRDLLLGMIRCVFVRRRRGAPASERALIVERPNDSLELPGPHRSGPFPPVEW